MNKKKTERLFTILIALTILSCLILTAVVYWDDKNDPGDIFQYFATFAVLFFGALLVLYEVNLFYTITYFKFRQKDKRTSFFIIAAHVCLVLFTADMFLSEFSIMELRKFETVLPWLFGMYLIFRIAGFISIKTQKKQ